MEHNYKEQFIKWRDKHKETIRNVLIIVTVLCLVYWFHFPLKTHISQINDIYNQDKIELLEQQQQEYFNKDSYSPQFNLSEAINDQNQKIEFEHSPVVLAIWDVINIQFFLFVLALLWKQNN